MHSDILVERCMCSRACLMFVCVALDAEKKKHGRVNVLAGLFCLLFVSSVQLIMRLLLSAAV